MKPHLIVTLDLSSSSHSLNEIEAVVGIRCDRKWSRSVGDQGALLNRVVRNDHTLWRLKSPSRSRDIDVQVAALLGKIRSPRWGNRRDAIDEFSPRVVVAVFYKTVNVTVGLRSDTIERLAELRLGLEICAYPCD